MKTIFFSILFAVSITAAYSQTIEGTLQNDATTFVLNDSVQVSLGDTMLIDLPASDNFLFVKRKAKLSKLSKLKGLGDVGVGVGSALGSIGIATGSIGAIRTGTEIMNAGSVASSVGMTSEAIENLSVSKKAKKLIGKKTIVEEFVPVNDGDAFIKAIVIDVEGKKRHEVLLAPAIYAKEIFIINK